METGKALFKLYHFTLPSPTGSTAQHPCEFTACGINDVAAPRMKCLPEGSARRCLSINSHVRLWHVCDMPRCPQFGRYHMKSGRGANISKP
jgi:hypothetical protein